MITEALRHFPGIGPVRLAKLHELGLRSWDDIIARIDCVPASHRPSAFEECCRCQAALEAGDIRYFVDRFDTADRWRILGHFADRTSFFDIETTGLELDATISTIACWHRGRLHTFVEHENLDDFLDLLDDVDLLASFNGNSFDVPRVLDAFHIPELPCPHVDMRWSCYHRGWRGGLKDIAARQGIRRPADLGDIDGSMAVELWYDWTERQNSKARDALLRYCAADVLMLAMLANRLAGCGDAHDAALWEHLPSASEDLDAIAKPPVKDRLAADVFARGVPRKLRALRRRVAG